MKNINEGDKLIFIKNATTIGVCTKKNNILYYELLGKDTQDFKYFCEKNIDILIGKFNQDWSLKYRLDFDKSNADLFEFFSIYEWQNMLNERKIYLNQLEYIEKIINDIYKNIGFKSSIGYRKMYSDLYEFYRFENRETPPIDLYFNIESKIHFGFNGVSSDSIKNYYGETFFEIMKQIEDWLSYLLIELIEKQKKRNDFISQNFDIKKIKELKKIREKNELEVFEKIIKIDELNKIRNQNEFLHLLCNINVFSEVFGGEKSSESEREIREIQTRKRNDKLKNLILSNKIKMIKDFENRYTLKSLNEIEKAVNIIIEKDLIKRKQALNWFENIEDKIINLIRNKCFNINYTKELELIKHKLQIINNEICIYSFETEEYISIKECYGYEFWFSIGKIMELLSIFNF